MSMLLPAKPVLVMVPEIVSDTALLKIKFLVRLPVIVIGCGAELNATSIVAFGLMPII